MITSAIWCKQAFLNYSETSNCTRPSGLCLSLKKFTRSYQQDQGIDKHT